MLSFPYIGFPLENFVLLRDLEPKCFASEPWVTCSNLGLKPFSFSFIKVHV